jgi:hypothetical protein
MYELSRIDGSQARQMAGSELLRGLPIALEAGGSEVLRFHVVPEPRSLTLLSTAVGGALTYIRWKRTACGTSNHP